MAFSSADELHSDSLANTVRIARLVVANSANAVAGAVKELTMATDVSNPVNIPQALAAVGALGVASYGLVDSTKAFWGGVSNFGFHYILGALQPFRPALSAGSHNWRETLHSHWLNGTPLDQQKAAAKSLVRLGLNPGNASVLAAAGHVDPVAFSGALTRLYRGEALTTADLNVVGRFDAAVDSALDAGYERADQKYRNSARVLAAGFSLVLAMTGGWLLTNWAPGYWGSPDFVQAVLVGIVAVPLAPIAKDVASSLAAAVGSLKALRGG